MCVAAPGRIVSIEGNTAVVEYNTNRLNANIGVVDAKAGDWVLVHAGLVIQVLSETEAESMLDLYAELEAI